MKAVVTGAGKGFGCAIALELWKSGFEIVCLNHRAYTQSLPPRWRNLEVSVEDYVRWAIPENEGYADVLVNNAGIYGPIGPLVANDWQEWAKTVTVDLLAAVRICQLVLPGMISRGYGKIINISGGGATKARPNFSAYSTSKAALVRFTETLAEEVKLFHIDVNAVAPGMMKTGMTDKVLEAGPELAGADEYRDATSCTETPERAAKLVAFLSSHESDGITGRLISVHDQWEGMKAEDFDYFPDRYKLRRWAL